MSKIILNNKEIDNIKQALSKERFDTYYKLSGKNDLEALFLYKKNLLLSQKFYVILGILEVCLRNKIDQSLKQKFGDDWIFNSKVNFSEIQVRILSENKKSTTQIVPALSFGFWVSFFDRSFEEFWRQNLRSIFNVERITRSEVAFSLRKIKLIRNRIAHHEPIINIDLEDHETTAFKIIGMLSKSSLTWLKNDLINN
jgi:hypothetical protein